MVWLYRLSTVLLYLGATINALPDECLILATNHNGGVNVTATLSSGSTVTQHFPNITLPSCGDDVKCPTIRVDQANNVNITDTVGIVQVESGLLLFSIHYNGTLTSLEITDSYTVQLPCSPLSVLPSNIPSIDYLTVCYQNAAMEVRHLILNSTNLAGSTELPLVARSEIFEPSLNRSLVSNFLPSSTESILFAYGGDLYRISTSINEIRSLGNLETCQDANKIKPLPNDEVIAFCSDRAVLFSVPNGLWKNVYPQTDPIDLNLVCPGSPGGQLILSTSTLLYPDENVTVSLPAPYGGQLLCTGTNGLTFLVYKDNSSLSNVWLVDLSSLTSVQLTENDCSSNTEIVTFQGRYVVVSNQINGVCQTVLVDIVNNASIPVVSQSGRYLTIGIVSGFIQNPTPPPSPATTTEMPMITSIIAYTIIGVIGILFLLAVTTGAIPRLIHRWCQHCRNEPDSRIEEKSTVTQEQFSSTPIPATHHHNEITPVPERGHTKRASLCVAGRDSNPSGGHQNNAYPIIPNVPEGHQRSYMEFEDDAVAAIDEHHNRSAYELQHIPVLQEPIANYSNDTNEPNNDANHRGN